VALEPPLVSGAGRSAILAAAFLASGLYGATVGFEPERYARTSARRKRRMEQLDNF
jgi:hypothetical protein